MHVCEYEDGECRKPGIHGGVPDPDPLTARVEDFAVGASDAGELHVDCAHYARGCGWTAYRENATLGGLTALARRHLEESHRTIDGVLTSTKNLVR